MKHAKPHSVLREIENTAARDGHQNPGIISRSHGFLPTSEPLKDLPPHFKCWDELVCLTPELLQTDQFRQKLDEMPVLKADEAILPDRYLHRAAVVLGFFAHAYARAGSVFVAQDELPDSILFPWTKVCERLGRPFPVLTYFDLVGYNWKYKTGHTSERIVENMELLFPIFDNMEERILYLTQTEMLYRSAPVISLVNGIYDCMAERNDEGIIDLLKEITACMRDLTEISFQKITASKCSEQRMDPVVFAKTMMSFAVPIQKDTPGPSGAAFPTFHLLDIAFGRVDYNSQIGMETLKIRSVFPPAVRQYFASLKKNTVTDYVNNRNNPHLTEALVEFHNSYDGPDGFLAIHRKKIYGFLQTAFQVGRSETIGGYSGKGADHREWRIVHDHLEEARKERKINGV